MPAGATLNTLQHLEKTTEQRQLIVPSPEGTGSARSVSVPATRFADKGLDELRMTLQPFPPRSERDRFPSSRGWRQVCDW